MGGMEQSYRPAAAGIIDELRSAGCVYAEEEAAILAEAAETPEQLARMLGQRVSGFPLEYIVGWAEFDGARFTVAPGVFVPRRRSVFLVQSAFAVLTGRAATGDAGTGQDAVTGQTVLPPVVVDLCCGAGALGAALVRRLAVDAATACELHAVDVDAAAVSCAAANIAAFGGQAWCGNLFDPLPQALRGNVDLIVANAPYVPSGALEFMPREARLYEPTAALDGGVDGLDVHRDIAAQAGHWLRPGGTLLLESSGRQGAASAEILSASGFSTRLTSSTEFDVTVVAGTSGRGRSLQIVAETG